MKKITLLLLFLLASISGYSQLALEGFENTTGITGPLPATWALGTGNWAVFERNTPSTVGTAQSWGINAFAAALPYQGANCASVSREQISIGNKSEDFLATPAVTIPVNGELHFFNRMFTSGDQGTIYQIRLAPATSSQTDPASYTILAKQWTEADLILPVTNYNVYTEEKVDLSTWATGGPYFVAFVKVFNQPTVNIDGDRWLVDNVSINVKCPIPVVAATTSPTPNGATLNWSNPGGANSWELEIILSTATPTGVPNHTYNGVPPYTVTDLLPNTSYKYYVRGICSTGYTSDWAVVSATFTTGVAPPGCGGNYVDPGGPNANYPNAYNNTNTPQIICPTTVGDAVTITFTSFAVSNNDFLKIYDGDNTGATLLANLTGTTLPESYTSNATNGCLTFVFTSNPNGNSAGWISNITCAPPPSCRKPGIPVSSAITSNSVTLNWTQGPSPDTTTPASWHVLALPCGSLAPVAGATGYVTAGTNTNYLFNTGLTSATCYDIYIRAVCSGTDNSVWVGPISVTTLVSPPVCGGNFVDTGGLTGNYSNTYNNTATPNIICPTTPGDVVTVTFTSFATETSTDGLYVYDGNTVTAANLIASNNGAGTVPGGLAGSYWGTTIPGPFTSSSPNGCLTFVFRSNGNTTAAGWVSTITCAPPPSCRKPTSFATSNVTYNSVTLNWAQPTNPDGSVATAWQVLKLPCGSAAPTANTTGWVDVTSPPPFTLTGLASETCYDIYVRAVCSGTETSAWTGPRPITTPIAPPVCGGVFVDPGGVAGNYPNGFNNTATPTIICPTVNGEQVTVTFTLFNTELNWDGLYVYDGNTVNAATLISSGNPPGNVPGGLAGSYSGNLTGNNIPGPFTASGASGCLTFVFRSDPGVPGIGWVANVTCAPPPTCLRPILPIVTGVTSTSATLGWTDTNPIPATQWEVLVLTAGSPLPLPTATGTIVSANPALLTGLLPATQYTFYVRAVCSDTDHSTWSVGRNFLTLIINDECSGAIFVPVNSTSVCQQVASGTITGATASAGPAIAPCIGTPNDDVWFQFVATNPYLNVSLQTIVGSVTNLNFAVYSGSCGTLTRIFCSAAGEINGVVNNMTVGNTYYIRVYSNSAAAQTVTFDVCVSTPSTCLTGSASVCSLSNYSNSTGIDSLGTIGCLTSAPNPAYFTIQVATSGPINFLLTQSSTVGGAPNLDVDYAAWGPFTNQTVACAAIAGGQAPGIGVPVTETTGCSFSPDSIENLNITNAIAGQYYIVLITNYSDDPGFINLTQTNGTSTGAGTTNCCPDAYFKYLPATYCKAAGNQNPSPIIQAGSLGGIFSSTPGLVFADSGTNTNSSSGTVNLLASTAGNYIVTNTTAATATCISYSKSYTISIVEPTAATITYGAGIPAFCKSITTLQTVTQTGTPNGTYAANPPVGLSINPANGDINPSLSSPGIYTVTYGIPGSVCTTGDPSAQVEILALPNIIQPAPVTQCNSYTLPTLAVGNYFSQPGGVGPIDPSVPLTSSQTVYIYAVGANTCINEKSFTVTINSVPTPVFTVAPSDCANPTGTVTVTSPTGTAAPIPGNLFISEVTDATNFAQTYIEIYNGTGAPVNLSNYKLRTFNNGSATVTSVCDNALSGTLNNNSTFIVSVGATTNAPGVTPNLTFANCTGVNWDDCIKLTTSTNTVIDVWGRTDGVSFTPLGQAGYDYRRLQSAVHPSTTFDPADWNVIDWTATTEDFGDVGQYVYAISNYQYSIDNGVTYQNGTATGIIFNNLAAGDHILIVKDVITGCLSAPITINIGVVDPIPTETGFDYPPQICQNATPNPSAHTFDGFTTGSTFYEVTTTGLVFLNTTTGEIDLANSTSGLHTIRYEIALPATCQYSFTEFTININPIITPNTAFTYTTPICQNAANPSAGGVILGGTFSEDTDISTGLVFLNTATGEIDLVNSTTGSHTIKYTVAQDDSICRVASVTSLAIVINPIITPNTSFSYTSPICQDATPNPSANGVVLGGTFSEDTLISTGLVFLNTSTGEIDLVNSTTGSHTIKYEVTRDDSICRVYSVTSSVLVINPVTTANATFFYTTPICKNAQNPSAAGVVLGGTFSEDTTTGLVFLNTSTGLIDLVNSTVGSHTIKYVVNGIPANCVLGNTSTFNIVINPVVTLGTSFDYENSPFCSVSSGTELPRAGAGFTSGGSYSTSGGLILNTSTGAIDLSSPPGNYTVTYMVNPNTSNCEVSTPSTTPVVIVPPVVIALNGGCQTTKYILTVNPVNGSFNPDAATYVWEDENGVDFAYTQSIEVTIEGEYTVTVTVDGCSTTSLPFDVTSAGCVIQKGISVNNDGRNDTFDLTGFDVKKLTIFNRLGMKVYTRNNYVNEWGGKSDDGDELPDGTYFYVIDKNVGGTVTGWIYINRAQ